MNLPSGPGPSQEIFPPPDPVVPPTTVVKREGMNRGDAHYAVLMPREFVRPCLSLSILPLISPPVLEVAVGDNKIKPINPKKGGDRHGNFSHEL